MFFERPNVFIWSELQKLQSSVSAPKTRTQAPPFRVLLEKKKNPFLNPKAKFSFKAGVFDLL